MTTNDKHKTSDKHYTPERAETREKRRLAKVHDLHYRPVNVNGHQVWVFVGDESVIPFK